MKKPAVLLTMVLGIAAFAIYSCQSKKTDTNRILKFDPEKGKMYRYETVWEIGNSLNGLRITSSGTYEMSLLREENKIRVMSVKYKAVRSNTVYGEDEINIDSEKPFEAEVPDMVSGWVHQVFLGVIDKPFIMKVDEQGNIMSVDGIDSILADLLQPLDADQNTKTLVTISAREVINSNAIKDQFAQVFTIYPDKKVVPGDTWEKSILTTSTKTGATYTTTYVLQAVEEDHSILAAETKISTNEELGFAISGSQKGLLVVQNGTGLVLNATFDQAFERTFGDSKIEMTGKGKIKGKVN